MNVNNATTPENDLPVSPYRERRRRVAAPRRSWCFTINNPMSTWTSGHEEFIVHATDICGTKLRYMVFQVETGDNGTPHYQGYMEFTTPVRFRWLSTVLKNAAHLEWRRGTREQARDYCMKESTRVGGPWEVGTWRSGGQGTRMDLLAVTDYVQTGAKESDVASRFPCAYIKFHGGINKLISLSVPRRTVPPVVTLLYGPTGTGKTKYCWDTFPDLYSKPPSTRWFDGYEAGKVVLLDDFCGASSKVSVLYLLQLLDRYPFMVEAKGKYVPFMAEQVLITTNYHPSQWYNWVGRDSSFQALKRRIHHVYYFSEYGTAHISCSKDTFFDNWCERFVGEDDTATYCIPRTQPSPLAVNAVAHVPPPGPIPIDLRTPEGGLSGDERTPPSTPDNPSSSEDENTRMSEDSESIETPRIHISELVLNTYSSSESSDEGDSTDNEEDRCSQTL